MPVVYLSTPQGIAKLTKRFWKKVNKDGPVPEHCPELGQCWIWTASLTSHGYGRISRDRNCSMYAHRVSYILHFEDPGSLFVCHKCDNRICVNPSHLFLGTPADNTADMVKKGRGRSVAELNPASKLSADDIREIIRRRNLGEMQKSIARDFPVCKSQIANIVAGICWASVSVDLKR